MQAPSADEGERLWNNVPEASHHDVSPPSVARQTPFQVGIRLSDLAHFDSDKFNGDSVMD